MVETVLATGTIMLIICAAGALGFYMSWVRIPQMATEAMLSLSANPYVLMLLINLVLLVAGMLIEGTALLILLAPILVPVVGALGMDPVHFGIVMVLNLTLGGLTPPLGTLMFVACSVAQVPVGRFVREAVPFILVLVAALLLITYVPAIALWLPDLGR